MASSKKYHKHVPKYKIIFIYIFSVRLYKSSKSHYMLAALYIFLFLVFFLFDH